MVGPLQWNINSAFQIIDFHIDMLGFFMGLFEA
jgi:hypothetical protein